jgi:hypothetical protein
MRAQWRERARAASAKKSGKQFQDTKPRHRPRKDPNFARIQMSTSVHPRTKKILCDHAESRGLSLGLLLDEIAAMLPNAKDQPAGASPARPASPC